jgi:hypothetical protein
MPIPKLNEYLQPINSPIATRPNTFYLDQLKEIESKSIQLSQIKLVKFCALSNAAAAQTASMLEQNNGVTLTTSLTPVNPPTGYKSFGMPFIAAYEGTAAVGTLQIFPSYGDSSLEGDYYIQNGYDYASYSGTNSVYKLYVRREAAGSAHLYFVTQWKFFDSNPSQT